MLIFKGIIVAILAFGLGVTFTLFCMQIKNGKNREDGRDR